MIIANDMALMTSMKLLVLFNQITSINVAGATQ